MKLLKVFFSVIIVLSIITTACEDETDSLNENVWLTTGTIITQEDSFYILTDGGSKLSPISIKVNVDDLKDGMRVLFNYSVIDEASDNVNYDYYINLLGIEEILTKPVFKFTEQTTQEVIDSIGNSPIHILDAWITDDYLSVQFEYWAYNKIHYVNLVHNSMTPETENGEILLELKHNDNGDYKSDRSWGIASFDIHDFQKENQDSVQIFVRSMGYNDIYEYNKVFTYRYNNAEPMAANKYFENIENTKVTLVR